MKKLFAVAAGLLMVIAMNAQARFVSVDPVPPDGNTGKNFCRYCYVNDNPYRFTDPDGRQSREFNFENQRLGVTPPPRAPSDWLGPAIGGSLAIVSAPALVYGGMELGIAALANPVAANNIGMAIAEGAAGTSIGINTIVTPAKIESALAGSTMQTTQKAVSLPAVQRYVDKLEGGSIAPAIKVADNVIIDGNHRYVAGRIVGQEPAMNPGTLSPSRESMVRPIQEINIDTHDWGNK